MNNDVAVKNWEFVVIEKKSTYKPKRNHILLIRIGQLVGQPLVSARTVPEFSHGRVMAVLFSTTRVDPLLPIPLVDAYPEQFIILMRQYADYLINWTSHARKQSEWYSKAEKIVNNILKIDIGLTLGEPKAFEVCLRYTLVCPWYGRS
jgi:hypothetical protein